MKAITIQGQWGEALLNQKFLKRFVGKRVIVTVIELDEAPAPPQREWSLLGSAKLGGQLDGVNVWDYLCG